MSKKYAVAEDDLTINEIDDTSADGNHVVTVGLGFLF